MSEEMVNANVTLQIETISSCNARCHFCVYKNNYKWRAGKKMDDKLFYKIIDEAATIKYFRTFIFHGLCEPLLDSRIEQFVDYTNRVMPKGTIKNLFTNGVYLFPERFDALRKAGLDSIIISLNANNQEQHERVMGLKGKFDQVVANTEYARANRGDMINFQVDAVHNDDQFPEAECYKFLEKWGVRYGSTCPPGMKQGTGVGLVVREGNWAGENRTIRMPEKNNTSCARALSAFNVLYTGVVSACCFDPTGKLTFGDLNTQSIREIYNSDKYVQFRQDHFENKADNWEICAKCSRI